MTLPPLPFPLLRPIQIQIQGLMDLFLPPILVLNLVLSNQDLNQDQDQDQDQDQTQGPAPVQGLPLLRVLEFRSSLAFRYDFYIYNGCQIVCNIENGLSCT